MATGLRSKHKNSEQINLTPFCNPSDWEHSVLLASRWSTNDHYRVQPPLGATYVSKVTWLKHLAVVANHLSNVGRIVAAVFRTNIVYIAGKFLTIRNFAQPGTTSEMFTGVWINPDFFTLNETSNIRSIGFPPADFFRRSRQATIAPILATLAA